MRSCATLCSAGGSRRSKTPHASARPTITDVARIGNVVAEQRPHDAQLHVLAHRLVRPGNGGCATRWAGRREEPPCLGFQYALRRQAGQRLVANVVAPARRRAPPRNEPFCAASAWAISSSKGSRRSSSERRRVQQVTGNRGRYRFGLPGPGPSAGRRPARTRGTTPGWGSGRPVCRRSGATAVRRQIAACVRHAFTALHLVPQCLQSGRAGLSEPPLRLRVQRQVSRRIRHAGCVRRPAARHRFDRLGWINAINSLQLVARVLQHVLVAQRQDAAPAAGRPAASAPAGSSGSTGRRRPPGRTAGGSSGRD